ncbi:hypothetical protein AXG93_4324s1210 [Marchantia polymorpha subsp. ruderalis]|uniref:Uncharacterized protein n=1 Tax=Marchantia polymorpha subsp. ruderalis TaxID=1480154 RepID=A0A176VZW1_MARPO|nr:hypothetical protein AXG93_4324s1210 [Marchantia polymorpha subsp. ruderalis]
MIHKGQEELRIDHADIPLAPGSVHPLKRKESHKFDFNRFLGEMRSLSYRLQVSHVPTEHRVKSLGRSELQPAQKVGDLTTYMQCHETRSLMKSNSYVPRQTRKRQKARGSRPLQLQLQAQQQQRLVIHAFMPATAKTPQNLTPHPNKSNGNSYQTAGKIPASRIATKSTTVPRILDFHEIHIQAVAADLTGIRQISLPSRHKHIRQISLPGIVSRPIDDEMRCDPLSR